MIYRRDIIPRASIEVVVRRREIFYWGLIKDNITRDHDLSRMNVVELVVSVTSIANQSSLSYVC